MKGLLSSLPLLVISIGGLALQDLYKHPVDPEVPDKLMLREAFEKRFGAEPETRGEVRSEAESSTRMSVRWQ